MKYISTLFIVMFLFIGCSSRQEVEVKIPHNTWKENKISNINRYKTVKKEDLGVKVEKLKPLDIEEDKSDDEDFEFVEDGSAFNIALIYPSRLVSKYAKESIDTIIGYLSYKNINYNFKVIDTVNEDIQSMQNGFNQAKEAGFSNVIALFTPLSVESLSLADTSGFKIYLPLLKKDETMLSNENFVYGSISYADQVKKLLEYSNGKNALFYQNTYLGKKINDILQLNGIEFLVNKEIKKQRNYFKGIVKDYRIKNSSLFLNTSLVKSSLLLSQLYAYEVEPYNILAIQTNYNPKLISLTQSQDRQKLLLANSIPVIEDKLVDTIKNLGVDVAYNWVSYSTLVGVNYLYDRNYSSLLQTVVENKEAKYLVEIYGIKDFGFLEIN